MKYKKQPGAPSWFKSDDSKIYECATSGSHHFNEWYEFDSREEAIDFISSTFSSQSFVDLFTLAQGEVYDWEDIHAILVDQVGNDHDFDSSIEEVDLSSLTPSGLGEMIESESRF